MGVPSVFLRLFGCNFKCRGFGMPKGKMSDEYKQIDVAKATTLKELPLVKTGCDSYASWDPRCKHLTTYYSPSDLSIALTRQTPNLTWLHRDKSKIHLVITGGEPLLGWQGLYPQLLGSLKEYGLTEVTFETNGTQMLGGGNQKDFVEFLSREFDIHFTFSVSPKLSVSGEKWKDAIKPDVVAQYEKYGTVVLKFVVECEKDCIEVSSAVEEYYDGGLKKPEAICLMPVGGMYEEYHKNSVEVANICLKKGWRYSPRLHCDLYGNAWGK